MKEFIQKYCIKTKFATIEKCRIKTWLDNQHFKLIQAKKHFHMKKAKTSVLKKNTSQKMFKK